eukprot:COSAG06_NODE_9156_length_1971_cov_22999.808761_2_plen_307_part_00
MLGRVCAWHVVPLDVGASFVTELLYDQTCQPASQPAPPLRCAALYCRVWPRWRLLSLLPDQTDPSSAAYRHHRRRHHCCCWCVHYYYRPQLVSLRSAAPPRCSSSRCCACWVCAPLPARPALPLILLTTLMVMAMMSLAERCRQRHHHCRGQSTIVKYPPPRHQHSTARSKLRSGQSKQGTEQYKTSRAEYAAVHRTDHDVRKASRAKSSNCTWACSCVRLLVRALAGACACACLCAAAYILSASFLLLCFRAIPTVTTLARRIAPAAPADRSPPGCCWAADAAEGERCSSSLLPRAGERRAFGVE